MAINWRDVEVWHLDSGKLANEAEAHALLAEYRATAGMVNAVLADPADYPDTPEGVETLCDAGPAVGEIDWAGFDDG
jgi:hypothetical protein